MARLDRAVTRTGRWLGRMLAHGCELIEFCFPGHDYVYISSELYTDLAVECHLFCVGMVFEWHCSWVDMALA